ncbi:MAG: UDP-N-acetylmuramoyl-L-alanine--D-glutamate ligase [Candidatus Pacebacteria bacterium]|nr:UDP-N-acetylmuramoyl-L-alanine--D-glutamate ligase [Candidatus Paceibacterota bacterium]
MTTLKNKSIVVLGLGSLGGGVATVNWLLDQGARVTVSDLKDAKALASSVKRVEDYLKRTARDGKSYEKARARLVWALGGHTNALIDGADMIVANPDVSIHNPYITRALKKGIPVENEGTLFFQQWTKPVIGVTGTRGKTTTATWTNHFVGTAVLTGNSVTEPFLEALTEHSKRTSAVTELSSFVLEYFDHLKRSPKIAIVTNLYRDHLNRHGTMEEYAKAKARIFQYQTSRDSLILNADNEWTPWFLRQKPLARVFFTSLRQLPPATMGVWFDDDALWEWKGEKAARILELPGFSEQWGMHNVANLMQATLAAHLTGVSYDAIVRKISSLPVVAYRQEVIYRDSKLTVVNDTTATSPEAGIAAAQRWGGPTSVLIAGGTDRDLDYKQWAEAIRTSIRKTNLILLSGSATKKMRRALGQYGAGVRSYDTLESAWGAAQKRACKYVNSVVLFSPAAKSFELFANEYDRGQQFNAVVASSLKKKRR